MTLEFLGQKEGMCFLCQEENEEYAKVFKAIRLQHIMNDKPSLSTIETDRIIPDSKYNVLMFLMDKS